MNRVAFKMKLFPGYAQEYKKRHQEIWPELERLLKKAGVRDYSIFLDEETHVLFATLKVNHLRDLEKLPALKVMKEWWAHMADIMETNPDNSPVSKNLTELFYLL